MMVRTLGIGRGKAGGISSYVAAIRKWPRAQKITVTVMVGFFLLLGGGYLTFGIATEYTGERNRVCVRNSEGDRTCSDWARSLAEFSAFFGVPTTTMQVTSEPLLLTSRLLFASAVPYVGGMILAVRKQGKRAALG